MVAADRHLIDLSVRRFRAFERFSMSFGPTAVLVGPNNAGKSSIISALRASAQMLRVGRRLRAKERIVVGEAFMYAHPFTTPQVGLDEDSLRWESRAEEVTLSVGFMKGCGLKAVWPADDQPYFYLHTGDKRPVREPSEVKELFPQVGVLPPIAPVERREELLDPQYVRENVSRRLASRHFRNQLYRSYRGDLPDVPWLGWCDFLRDWLSEIKLQEPEIVDRYLDVYFREERAPGWKEIVWAGDGFQVFVQLLFHLYRLRDSDVLVVDEPDIYLHADLQRRLMQAAQSLSTQLVVATHSTEIAAEVGSSSIIWMDRTRQRAVRAPDEAVLTQVAGGLGSQFNIRLARVLRAKLALFVEGDDMRLLKHAARLIGATAFANEADLALVPIEGSANWKRLEGFGWLVENLLGGSVAGVLLLDRDYHCDAYASTIVDTLRDVGIDCHIWQRKELESYFLIPSMIARASGAPEERVSTLLEEITEHMYDDVLFNYMSTYKQDYPESRALDDGSIGRKFAGPLRGVWNDSMQRLWRCPAKDVWARMNEVLQSEGHRPVSIGRPPRELRAGEVPEEMATFIRSVNRRLIS